VRRFAPQLCAQVFCITLLLLFVSNSKAQLPIQERIQDPVAREKLLARLARRDDFRKLQVVNNDLMKRVFKPSGTQNITLGEIRSRLSEIRKLAERLRESLDLPKLETEEPAIDLALKPGLLQLDKTIVSFVDNPSFRELRVYDAELASQAAKDLHEVSRLAEALRRLTKEKL
jgi:hypothetical protein